MNKKLSIILVSILLLTSTLTLTIPALAEPQPNLSPHRPTHKSQNEKEWTFMLYDDADFQNAWDPLADFTTEVYSGPHVNIIVLQDTENGPAKLWYIDHNHTQILLEELEEINMGDATTLKDFITYTKTHYPAKRYLMDLYNHGAGWKGACKDDTSNSDLLTMNEIQHALTETNGIDIIMFNAPCLMGSLEAAYELRNQVDVYIGSEELCGYKLGLSSLICTLLHTQPTLPTINIGSHIINFVENLGGEWAHKRTMAAVHTKNLTHLKQAINKICLSMILRWFRTYHHITTARNQTFELGEYPDIQQRYRLFDFYGFTEHLCNQDNINHRIQQHITNVQNAYTNTIINEYHGSSKPDTNGLNIYFPYTAMEEQYEQYRDKTYGLDFTADTLWDEFLGLYILSNKILP